MSSVSVTIFDTGGGISDDGIPGDYIWAGHSFNPTSDVNDGYQSWDYWDDDQLVGNLSIYGQTNTFDLSGMQYGQEVVMGVIQYSTSTADSGALTLQFKDPNNAVVWSWAQGYDYAGPMLVYAWIGGGIKNFAYDQPYPEIHMNGTYTFYYYLTYNGGASNMSGTKNFVVSNHPSPAYIGSSVGKIWVEGSNIAFICDRGFKILVPNDSSTSSVGTAYSGNVWLEDNGKISYIDSAGNERKTKFGDKYGYGGWSSEIPATPGTAYSGNIWVCNDNNDTYLMIVSPDGEKYRIGAGSSPSGSDHQ